MISSDTKLIPSDLKTFLVCPNTPWKISQGVADRLDQKNKRYKAVQLHSSDPEAIFVLPYFNANKPMHYDICNITCIYNPYLQAGFAAHLIQIEEEAKKFLPSWEKEDLAVERRKAIESWKKLTAPFSPIKVTIEDQEDTLQHAKVSPFWHGTSCDKAVSICESGFTYFGKHGYFTGKGSSGSTGIGYIKEYDQALVCFDKALTIFVKVFSVEHARTKYIMKGLLNCLDKVSSPEVLKKVSLLKISELCSQIPEIELSEQHIQILKRTI